MIELLIVGDFIPPAKSEKPFSDELLILLKDKDFSIANLEAPLTHTNNPILKNGKNFKVSPENVKFINEGCFDAVALSNNHIRDFGNEGVIDTLKVCNSNNINTVGAGINLENARKPLRVEIKEKRIVFLNYSEHEFNIASEKNAGANPFDNISAYYDIQQVRQDNDFVIVIYHGGIEYQHYPTLEMIKNFKFIIDIGADLVVAHHSHRYSGVIKYKSKPIIFGLGNFLCHTSGKINNEWLTGLIAKITLSVNAINYKLVPVKMSEDFRSVGLMKSEEAVNILNQIDMISASIQDQSFMINYWIEKSNSERKRIIQLLKSNSKIEYRARKYLPMLFRNKLSVYKRNILLNMLKCESHRYRLIRILENL